MGEEPQKTEEKRKMPKAQEKNNSSPNANNTGPTQANTRSAAAASQKNPSTDSDSREIIRVINALKTDMQGHNDCLKQELTQLRQEINGKLNSLTTAVQSLSDHVDEAESPLCTYLKQQRSLQQKLTDLESWSRRNNMRIFGVAEGEEGDSVLKFVEKFIKSELPASQNMELKIQRAHQTLAPRSRPDAPPRPIVVNFLEFTTKELILREAWKKKKIQVGERFVYFDHDYASEIVKKRKEYNTVKKALKEKGICFQTPHTSMQIHWATGVRTYNTAQEAQRELRKRGFPVEEPEPTEGESPAETRLLELMGWQQAAGCREKGSAAARRVREKLCEFQRGHTKDS
ncbi:unnamed protein product [Xyrichtys novacula]|uniref:Unnamed protein product n=1 Tax=Xyrichtys novacula TaxID=13765 RepID=A0AAV1G9D7_XYRNO|nr:unnamed protein product [Xyrichtys novacula]